MFRHTFQRADGRALHLYGREALTWGPLPPAPGERAGSSHMRWHPLRGEWVVYAPHRQTRTFLPPPDFNPLLPSADPSRPGEVPTGNWEVAAFDNLYPALSPLAGAVPETGLEALVETRAGTGACEVVVFSQEPKGTLGGLPAARIALVLEVLGERSRVLGERPDITYVFPFENHGVEVGVTLHHPHGQIYAYPFVPPIAARELSEQAAWLKKHGAGLLDMMIQAELKEGRRMIYAGEHAVAWVPVCARYAYEVWVAPRRPAPSLDALDEAERLDLARALQVVLRKYDGLWQRPFPYVLVGHQAPTDGLPHPEAHVHFELYPPLRMPGRLKYLAGTELGAGTFSADTVPEDKAAELQAVEVSSD